MAPLLLGRGELLREPLMLVLEAREPLAERGSFVRHGLPLRFHAGHGGTELRLVHHYVVRPLSAALIGGPRLAGFDFAPAESGTGDLEFELVAPGGTTDKTVKLTVEVGKTR